MDIFVEELFGIVKWVLLVGSIVCAITGLMGKFHKAAWSPIQLRLLCVTTSLTMALFALTLPTGAELHHRQHGLLNTPLDYVVGSLMVICIGQIAYYMKSGGWRAMLETSATFPGSTKNNPQL